MTDLKVSDPKLKSTPAEIKTALPQRTEARQSLRGAPTGTSGSGGIEPETEEVAALAYQLWIERGSPHGSHEEDWYRAEEELRGAQMLKRSAGA